jgi:flagellar biosynthesis chaperone FliJ
MPSKLSSARKRSRPFLNRRKEVEIQDDEPSDDLIRVNQNSAPAQVNGQYEARLSTSKSNSKAAEPNTCLRRSHHLPSRLVHDTPQSTIRHSGESEEHTTASFAESRMAPSVKRQRTDDVQSRLSQTSGLLDWNALLVRRISQPSLFCHNLTTLQPSGNEFKESLKAASTALAPSIKSFEQLLTSINDEHSRLTAVKGSLSSQRDELAKDQRKAEDALKDVETSTATENQMLRDLEDVYNKYPGDKELLIFLEKRKKTSDEHQEVYTIVKSQLDKSSAGLSKTESELAMVTRRLSQLEAERAEVMKEKEGVDKAAKQLMVMSRFLEPGWQATLDMLEQVSGMTLCELPSLWGFHCCE